MNFHAAAEPMRSVRTTRYNYIRIFDDDLRVPLANIDEGHAKTELLATAWPHRPREPVRLYDLLLDPGESCNVSADPRYREALEEMETRLRRWMEATDDPLLQGPLQPPPHARLNTRESLHPGEGPYISEGT